MQILIAPLAMYAAMKAAGVKREEMNQFATYLERIPDEEAPRGRLADYDLWFEDHLQNFRRTGNILIKN